ncbi:BEN domain-containing protein 5-like [Nothobranchius furzeri]|uniref:BEN domain-containing protein 5-like n=1 Tax=Nothobranchius furzeri TaxID=105023 RepID=UPI00390497E9
MFAYVRYIDDGCKEIVPTTFIKDFDSQKDTSKIYWVRWQDSFFKAQILMLKDTKEDIEEELSTGKRVRVKKVMDPSTSPLPSEAEEARTKKTTQKKAAEEAKDVNLLAILQERKNRKRNSPLCPTSTKKIREDILSDSLFEDDTEDDDNDGGVVPQKLYEEAIKKQCFYQKKYSCMCLQQQEMEKRMQEQEKSLSTMESENKTLRELNIELQQHLMKALKSTSSKSSDPATQNSKTLYIAESGSEDGVETPRCPEGEEIHLGGGVYIRREAWSRIKNQSKDSLFLKELAVAIWGTKTLGQKSLTGKACPTTKSTRQPLTPKKLETLRACFKEWLINKKLEEPELQARWVKAGRYLTEKIMDINKQKNKTPKD